MSQLLSFQSFVETVQKQLRDYLPERLADAEIYTQTIHKLNDSYLALLLKKEKQVMTPAIKMQLCYDDYQKGTSLEEIMQNTASTFANLAIPPQPMGLDELLPAYDIIRSQLFMRVSHYESNQKLLTEVPHRKVLDLAVTCHVSLQQIHGNQASVMVNHEMRKMWQISEEDLMKDVLENSPKIMPMTLRKIRHILKENGVSDSELPEQETPLYVLSTQGWNSAAALFYPDSLHQLWETFQNDFYVLPSSIHEVLILPVNAVEDRDYLRDMVKEINEHCIAPQEKLSDSIYIYQGSHKQLELA